MISIVIPAYNSERFLAQTVESVLAQSVSEWELVIVDDGSTDDTPQIMRRFAEQDRRIRAVTQPNGGVAAARNRGWQESDPEAEYIIFLDNDDTWEPDALEILCDALKKHPGATAAAGFCRNIDADGAFLNDAPTAWQMERTRAGKIEHCAANETITYDVIVCQNPIISPGMVLIRRECLEQIGPWDQAVAPADDWDIWARLTLHGPILTVPRVTLRYRMHGNNASKQSGKMKRGERAFYRKLMESPQLDTERRRMARSGGWNHEQGLYSGRRRWARDAASQKNLPLTLQHVKHALIHYFRALHLRYFSRV